MNSVERLLEPAYRLAYFIHPDTDRATTIVSEAVARLPVTIALQWKRGTYAPSEGFRRAKVRLDSQQVLQYLVLFQSEPLELLDEHAGQVGCDDLTIRYIKHVARRTMLYNSFYACVGVARVLCNFRTTEALDMYAFVADNRPKEDSECRRVRGGFIKSLEKRFGTAVSVLSVEHGEKQFASRVLTKADIDLANECMKRFTPWGTQHVIPDKYMALSDPIPDLLASESNGDAENRVELNRIHAFLDPECYSHLLKGLGIAALFEEKLMIPEFNCDKGSGQLRDRSAPPKLEDSQLQPIRRFVVEQTSLRQAALSRPIRLRVDGVELREVGWQGSAPLRVNVNPDAEVVELVGSANGRDVVLGTYILVGSEDDTDVTEFELELPFPHVEVGSVFQDVSDRLFDAINRLLKGQEASKWAVRLEGWSKWLGMKVTPIIPTTPPFGFANELRAGTERSNIYDVMLTADDFICGLELETTGEILVGIESSLHLKRDPLVLLVPLYPEGKPMLETAAMDSGSGLLVARFPDISPGTYVVCLEPQA